MRFAISRSYAGGIIRSLVSTISHAAFCIQAGCTTVSLSAFEFQGPCVAYTRARSAAGSPGTKSSSTPWRVSQSQPLASGLACEEPGAAGYPFVAVAADCPLVGMSAETYTNALTFGSFPASLMTMPAQECPTRTTGPGCSAIARFVAATSSANDDNGF